MEFVEHPDEGKGLASPRVAVIGTGSAAFAAVGVETDSGGRKPCGNQYDRRRCSSRFIGNARGFFSDPQVATDGLTEAAAREAGINLDSRVLDLENVPRALVNIESE